MSTELTRIGAGVGGGLGPGAEAASNQECCGEVPVKCPPGTTRKGKEPRREEGKGCGKGP